MQGDVGLSGALRLRVVARDLLGLWHRHAMLTAAIRGRGGHQQRLLGGRRQVQGSDLFGHQLLLNLVNEHQVIQLKGLTVMLNRKQPPCVNVIHAPPPGKKQKNIENAEQHIVQDPFWFKL